MIESENFSENEEVKEIDSEPSLEKEEMNELESQEESPQALKEKKESFSPQFVEFHKAFQEQTNSDQKLQLAIDFMEQSLAQGSTPHFRSFWEARRLALSLFKEAISPPVRAQAWNKYSDLSKEARRLKELLDEQSAFAVEQIEIAIKALENDITQFEEQAEKTSLPADIPFPHALKKSLVEYQDLQKKLNVLNVQASRINGLRKELIKTDMRVRQKNKFFQRLSTAGDAVFPQRKELIKQISQLFIEDVNQFVLDYFEESSSQESLYILREEIKALQGLAKVLTLNTQAFTQTRARLSECWDKLKHLEKERKKEWAHKKVIYKENTDQIQNLIVESKKFVESEEYSFEEANKRLHEISSMMREIEIGRNGRAFRFDVAERVVKRHLQVAHDV
ncbi:MAG: hypothetical protein LW832_08050, partial [Parachlamydia sp.]|nr:hypothetical protein [Parachlamydia sp.]